MVLEIQSIAPVTGRQDRSTNIQLFGTDFGANSVILVGQQRATNILVHNSEEITCTFPSDLENGVHDVTIQIGTDSYILIGAFIVVESFPAPPFQNQTFGNIITRMLGRLDSKYDITEGSFISDFYAPMAMELANGYLSMSSMVGLINLLTSKGVYLDYNGIERGVPRRKATRSIGSVKFIASEMITILAGTVVANTPFSRIEPTRFETNEDIVLMAEGSAFAGTVEVTAINAGRLGNLPAMAINRLLGEIPDNFTSVVNEEATVAGSNREEDIRYLSRILSQIRTPARAGNVQHYKRWAEEASDYVGRVGVDPLRQDELNSKMNGTVGIYILHPDNTVPTQELINEVAAYIGPDDTGKGAAPIGAFPTVNAPAFVDINVKITISVETGFVKTDLTLTVQESIEEFINNLDIGENLLYHNLATAVNNIGGVASVSSYAIDETNDPPVDADVDDIEINNTQKARAGTITIT